MKEITTEIRIPEIMASDLAELIYSLIGISGLLIDLIRATPTAAPSSSNTIETVVDVGIPKALKRSSSITSVIITARKITITSRK